MSEIAIRVENLSKCYRIGKAIRPSSRGQRAFQTLAAPFRHLSSSLREAKDDEILWALKEVSFEVRRGEVLGIIGRNGAGKSTLLKILSRITEPTSGRAVLDGRVGSLLEVGTGFNPELSGRENIYLSGAIFGMKKSEINRKFDEIVAFSETEKFLDTPVKRYSSGMYVRLAFAVAAHLEPEIMLIDEVLAVGDAAFQEKCLKRIRESTIRDVTTLFISHNMHAMGTLASRVIFIKNGKIHLDGSPKDVIGLYIDEITTPISQKVEKVKTLQKDAKTDNHQLSNEYEIIDVTVNGHSQTNELMQYDDLVITIYYRAPIAGEIIHFQVSIWTDKGILVTTSDTRMGTYGNFYSQRDDRVTCVFPSLSLITGHYFVRIYILSASTDWILTSYGWTDQRMSYFHIKSKPANMTTGMIWYLSHEDFGFVELPSQWQNSTLKDNSSRPN